jgi:thiol-disulfide isomerase/thioredoxin
MMKNLLGLFLLINLIAFGCAPQNEGAGQQVGLPSGNWRATLTVSEGTLLPFNFQVDQDITGKTLVTLINGDEKLKIDEIIYRNDSVFMTLHIFDAEIHAAVNGKELTGAWIKNGLSQPYAVPFYATHGVGYRFAPTEAQPTSDLTGTWDVRFYKNETDFDMAVGSFLQEGNYITGTFLTTTGDYRFLEGQVDGDQLMLSCFDGEHAYLFTANIENDGQLANGLFRSGPSWKQTWDATRNDSAKLPDAYTLTYLKDGFDQLAFTFPSSTAESQLVSLQDPRYKGKVVIVQIMGTWCPNCMDETIYLKALHEQFQPQGLEIIGLAYERSPEYEKASQRVNKMKDRMGIGYEVLIAGTNNKQAAAQTLPMLNHILSFPTTIVIDRQGKVRNIHTGFSGPGTGVFYEEFTVSFGNLIKSLLEEGQTS